MESTKNSLKENINPKIKVQGVTETPIDELFVKGIKYLSLGILQYFLFGIFMICFGSAITSVDNFIHGTNNMTTIQKIKQELKL